MPTPESHADDYGHWPPTFHGQEWVPVAFVVAFSLWAVISNSLFNWLFGPSPTAMTEALWNVPSGAVQLGLVLSVLRFENVRLRDLGLARRQFVWALVAVAGLILAVNGVVAGRMTLGGSQIQVAPFGLYRSPPLNYSASMIVAGGIAQYVFVGPVEELAFRGYLQTKLTALLGRGSPRSRAVVAIVATAVIFALIHVPTLLVVEGSGISGGVGALVMLALSGITFGTIYVMTRNLYLVALLHGVGNFWPLVVDPGAGSWPNWGISIALYALIVAVYRWQISVGSRPPDRPTETASDSSHG